MQLVKATEADNEKLIHFFSQTEFPGPTRFQQHRMFNFFNQYRIQSDDHVTYMLLNTKSEIEALASLIFKSAVLDGKKQVVGYATDLRVAPTRRAILGWSQHFLPVLDHEKKKRDCKYLFSTVAASQRQAYNAFVRPRNFRRKLPRYYLFRRFKIITLHGQWPFMGKPLSGIKIRTAQESDWEKLGNYVLNKTNDRPLKYYDSVDEMKKSIARWRDLHIESFLLALDRSDRVVGCVAPWSAERVQKLVPVGYGPKVKNLQDMLQVLSWFGLAHPLPREKEEFECRYLTHLYADNPDVFYSLLYNSYQQTGKKEFLVYPHFIGELSTLPPRAFISAEMPASLYCILSPNDEIPDFLRPKSLNMPPVFEPSFL